MLRAGNYASAKAHLDRAIALRPEQGEYYYNRANVLKEQKEFKAAIDDYTRAVASFRIWRARTSTAATCVFCCVRRKGPVRI